MLKKTASPRQAITGPGARFVIIIALWIGVAKPVLGAAAPRVVPSAVQAARLLELPMGNANYLPAYGRLIEFLWGKKGIFLDRKLFLHRRKVPVLTVGLRLLLANPKAAADFRAIANDIVVKGVSPVLLWNQILRTVTLSGRSVEPGHRKWKYSTAYRRQAAAFLFAVRADQLAKLGQTVQAARYAKACILLCSQDTLEFSSLLWIGTDSAFMKRWGIPAAVAEKFPVLYRRELAAYASRQKLIFSLYALGSKYVKSSGHLSPSAAVAYLRLLRDSLRALAAHLHEEYQFLRGLAHDRRSLNLSGHRGLSKKIKLALGQWAAKIKADHTVPKVERSALLRWIKEASI